jgi:cell division protein FtsI/penicillin-binding protein 2
MKLMRVGARCGGAAKVRKAGQTLVSPSTRSCNAAAEAALDQARNSGAVAAIDPRSGAVLALASRPHVRSKYLLAAKKEFQPRWIAYNSNKKHPLINRAVTSRYPPGSDVSK